MNSFNNDVQKSDLSNPVNSKRALIKGFGAVKIALIALGIIIVSLITFFILSPRFFLEARFVPAISMAPAINGNDRVLVNKTAYLVGDPSRGDIIVFEPPDSLPPSVSTDMIKRIIGVPGDTIRINGGKLFINGEQYDEPYLAEPMNYKYGPTVVPTDCYFVLGDNRNRSFDSRFDWYVPKKNIIGKAVYIYWPLEHAKGL